MATSNIICFPKQPKAARTPKKEKPKSTVMEMIRQGWTFPGQGVPLPLPPPRPQPDKRPEPLPPIGVPPTPNPEPGKQGGAQ